VTVRELIKVLTNFPPDHEVLLEDWSGGYRDPAPCNLVQAKDVYHGYGGKKIKNVVILDNQDTD
jgi:hypothetical protein